MPWFGMNHLCIDRTNGETYRGATCEAHDLLYKTVTVGSKHKQTTKTVRTEFYDHAGFPMIQNSKFNGQKYCGKKMPIPENEKYPGGTDLYYNFLNTELRDNSGCKFGFRTCS